MSQKPNILMLFTDQQRFDTIAALGNSVIKTPAMDRLCKSGVAFTSAYSPSPVCVPARCSMMYGQYPMHTQCYDNGYAMPADRSSFVQVLTDAGYRTHGIGKCHFTPDKFAMRGFQTRETQEEVPARDSDDYTNLLEEKGWGELPEPHAVRGEMYYVPQVSQLPQALHPTQWIGDRSVAFLEAQQEGDEPWFLYSSYVHPHPPFAPPAPWHKLYSSFDMPHPKVPECSEDLQSYINHVQNRYKGRDQGIDKNLARNIIAHYYGCISFVDFQIGRILDTLEATGQQENTLIVFSSDHGELLGDYNCYGKRSMHDSCSRVPMIVSQPGRFEGGTRCDQPATLVDLMPTFLSAANCDTDALSMDGVDLFDLQAGDTQRDAVYIQLGEKGKAMYTAITDRWKYSYCAPDQKEYLFDRQDDPLETRNHVDVPANTDALTTLREQTKTFLVDGGEQEAVDGGQWKAYPKLHVDPDPTTGLLRQDRPGFVLDLPGYTD
jgi:arylsulfatase